MPGPVLQFEDNDPCRLNGANRVWILTLPLPKSSSPFKAPAPQLLNINAGMEKISGDVHLIFDYLVSFDYIVRYDEPVNKNGVMLTDKGKSRRSSHTRQQRRASRTRQKLLEAGRLVFAEKGLDSATIADITERADVGKGTFYYHFKDKNSVIEKLIESVLGELVAALEKKCAEISDIFTLLDTIIGVHIEFFSSRWEDYMLYFQGRGDIHLEEGYEGIEPRYLNYLQAMEKLIESTVQGQISKQALRRIACAAAGFVSGYYSFAVIASEDEDVDKTLQSLRGALVSSLARFIYEALPYTDFKVKQTGR